MDEEQILIDLGPEILSGNAALWLGPSWQLPKTEIATRLASISWLAVWSESKNSDLASLLRETWSSNDRLKRRVVVEVPGRIADTLGSYFALSEVCPIFYLQGREDSWDTLPAREKRRARDEQVDVITKLRNATLVLVGFSRAEEIVTIIRDELPLGNTALRFIVIGLPAAEREVLSHNLSIAGPAERTTLHLVSEDLTTFVAALDHLFVSRPPRVRAIRAGKTEIDLSPVLEREHPIDQDFFVLTTEVLRAPEKVEDRATLAENLVAGRTAPWRAFAHDVQWKRDPRFSSDTVKFLRDVLRSASPVVTCVNMAAEPGSGLTTFLMEVAFRLAQSGYPTLVAKPGLTRINYDLLRTFLEHLSALQSETTPAVLVFDDSERSFDAPTGIQEMVQRLAKDGRRVLVVRGVVVRVGEALNREIRQSKGILSGRESDRLREDWISNPLRASLSPGEQESLVDWAVTYWQIPRSVLQHAIVTWGADWTAESDPPPLLVCLYFLLHDQLRSATNLGQHLFTRLEPLLQESKLPQDDSQTTGDTGALSGAALAEAAASLQRHFRSGLGHTETFGTDFGRYEAATLCVALAVLGALRIPAPRPVLSAITDLSAAQLNAILIALERIDLVRTSIDSAVEHGSAHLARLAYYTDVERVGLRHPTFGRLLLEWLLGSHGTEQMNLFSCNLLKKLTERIGDRNLPAYPIQLLTPLLQQVKLSQATLSFVEEICVRFLRLQRVRGSHYHQWQWSETDTVLDVVSSIPEAVARQSSVILHTRAITRYKSCRPSLNLDECRQRYELASEDLRLALDRSRKVPNGERPEYVITSHGLLYQGWARQERDRGAPARVTELRLLARQYLRDALRVGGDRENPYAAFGLAGLLIEDCEQRNVTTDEELANSLSEALDLLQIEPEPTFEVEWTELRQRALALLSSNTVDAVINNLKLADDELGVALEALRILGGIIPVETTTHNSDQIDRAWRILSDSGLEFKKSSQLATLLRYALFSVMPKRASEPAYEERFRLIEKLEGSRYLERPLWLFDYAMLAVQSGRVKIGLEAFRRLRRGGKFLEVPLERSRLLANPDKPTEVRIVRFQVVRTDDQEDKGWARVVDPAGFPDPVPFPPRLFLAAGSPTASGATLIGRLRIRPAGPIAEPMRPAG